MRSFLAPLATATISLSFLSGSQAGLSDSRSCGVSAIDDSYFSVVGVQGTGVHPRLELRELEKDPQMWNIFIQAWARFQAMDQNQKLSYFQIAGIHGAPFGEWDGEKGDGLLGYCPHLSNLFSTWHRPYLALFEQILHDRAVEIAREFPEGELRKQYQDAAARLRLPYWDWAMDPPDSTEGCMPSSLRRATTTVTLPNGNQVEIRNPLYNYQFHPLKSSMFDALKDFQFMNWNTTIRFPEDGYSATATSRNDAVNAQFDAQQKNNRDALYKLLTVHQPFNQWSNKANGGNIGNIETLHDGIHNTFGLGHMGIVEVSAFDPVFWFHHSNMDRILAIYQQRYPDTYVESSKQVKATYTMPRNSTQDASSPLKPFHMNAEGHLWTSDTVRNWESFGYTYPELAGKADNDTLTRSINRLYKAQSQGLIGNSSSASPDHGAGNNNKTVNAMDWMVAVKMPSDIRITYSVRAFLGEPSQDPSKWPTEESYVGQVASLASPRSDSGVIVTSNIGLTDKLAVKHKSGELKSLKEGAVKDYLRKNFHWRIQRVDGAEISRNDPPPGLDVTVVSVPISIPHSDSEVPTWTGAFEYKPEIKGNPPAYDGPCQGWNSTVPRHGTDRAGSCNTAASRLPHVTAHRAVTVTIPVTVEVPAPTA